MTEPSLPIDTAAGDADAIHDVALVGCGPTGATLANLLALRGLRVLVLEREAGIYSLPRAVHFDGESMRVFQTVGIADMMAPQLIVSPGMRFIAADGRVLIDWQRPTELRPQGWFPSYRFHQPSLEQTLRGRLAQHPNATLKVRHEVFALDERDGHVAIRHEDTASGRLHTTAARFVVGCDGARSLVRRLMGTELEDLRSHERWLVVDVVLKKDRPDLGDHAIQYCDPRRPATYVRGVGMRRRWELMLMPHDDPAAITRPESVWALLAPWLSPDEAELERPAVYTFHSVVARGWRKGRLLIAGDAAHQTPPFMGQGMCAGIRDAANLAWKLADVLQGVAPDSLLDSYESERSPHVREFIEAAVRFGAVIQTTDPEVARRRDAEMAADPQIFFTPQPRLGPGAHEGGEAGGRIGEQPRLADGARLDDAAGYRHALLVAPALAAAAAEAAGDAGLPGERLAIVAADSEPARRWLDALNAQAVLLRPDRYVAGVAAQAAEIARLLRPLGR